MGGGDFKEKENIRMKFLERELEDYLWENPDEYYNGSGEFRWCGRQVQVASGILDLLGLEYTNDGYFSLHLIELKADNLRPSHVAQVCRYAADLEPAMYGSIADIKKVLIGPGACADDVQFSADAMDVVIRQAECKFSISGSWGWKDEAKERHEEINFKAIADVIDPVLLAMKNALKADEDTEVDEFATVTEEVESAT